MCTTRLFLIFFSVFTYLHFIESVQNLYDIIPERCDVSFNNSLMLNTSFACNKISRKEMYLNVSGVWKVDIKSDEDASVLVTGYQFRSNEYRMGPIRFSMGICYFVNRHDLDIPNLLRYSNLKCPIIKGNNYYANNVRPNATNFPPLLPEGRWKVEIAFMDKHKYKILTVNYYAAIAYRVRYKL